MRRMMKNADIEYVGKLQKGTKVYVYPPVIGEDGFYILYDAKLTADRWKNDEDAGSEVNFESHELDGYIAYSSPLLDENNVISDIEPYITTKFPETINTYQDLANWIGENLSEFNITIEGFAFMGVNGSYIYDSVGDYEFENNQFFLPKGIEEVNGGETFVSIPEILLQNITGYEDQPIHINSNLVFDDFSMLKVGSISSAHNNQNVDIQLLRTYKFTGREIFGDGSLTITNYSASQTNIYMKNLPTSDPHSANAIWNDNGTLKISSGR